MNREGVPKQSPGLADSVGLPWVSDHTKHEP